MPYNMCSLCYTLCSLSSIGILTIPSKHALGISIRFQGSNLWVIDSLYGGICRVLFVGVYGRKETPEFFDNMVNNQECLFVSIPFRVVFCQEKIDDDIAQKKKKKDDGYWCSLWGEGS